MSNERRIEVVAATGDRAGFNGKSGRILRFQPRFNRPDLESFAIVRLDGAGNTRKGSRVFWPHELRPTPTPEGER